MFGIRVFADHLDRGPWKRQEGEAIQRHRKGCVETGRDSRQEATGKEGLEPPAAGTRKEGFSPGLWVRGSASTRISDSWKLERMPSAVSNPSQFVIAWEGSARKLKQVFLFRTRNSGI